MRLSFFARSSCVALALFSLAGCDKQAAGGGAGMQPPPMPVSVITVQSGEVALQHELPGRLEPSRIAEVRARVDGVVEQRLFVEGAEVDAGQSLFRIDAAPYEARQQAAVAQKARAQADLEEAEYQAKRYEQLFATKAVSEYDLVRVRALLKQTQAQLQVAEADLAAANIDLGYSRVLAPISGRIGRELVTEGALVSAAQATPLAIIQQVDPMRVSFSQDSNQVLALYQARAQGKIKGKGKAGVDAIAVKLLLADGSEYPHQGKLLFSDITVDAGTAQIEMRAEIPNPDGLLMPGMFVQVKFEQASYASAFLVPQQALMRSEKGDSVFVVGPDNIVNPRPVTVVASMKNQWLVTDGLKDGEQVMVEGFQKVRPGAPVTPLPWGGAAGNEAAAAQAPADAAKAGKKDL